MLLNLLGHPTRPPLNDPPPPSIPLASPPGRLPAASKEPTTLHPVFLRSFKDRNNRTGVLQRQGAICVTNGGRCVEADERLVEGVELVVVLNPNNDTLFYVKLFLLFELTCILLTL